MSILFGIIVVYMEAGDEEVMKSLRRSKIRIVVLLFIAQSYFRQANLKELCKGLNICASNILGALNGYKGRYKFEESLVGLGLVERVEYLIDGHKLIHYRLTEKGARIAGMLENEPMTIAMLGIFKAKEAG
jgi:predicted transcriptional regulator with HTH domain